MRYYRAVMISALMVLAAAGIPAGAGDAPASALERLKTGNQRFVQDAAAALPITAETRQAQVTGQSPFAILLSCADSRVPPEVIFNAGLGQLFVIRTAGEVADKVVLASIEYGAEHLKAPLLVVMGHESCGAVKAAVEEPEGPSAMGPNLDGLVGAIRPAFRRMTTRADAEHLREAVLANVEQVVNDILTGSAVVRHLMAAGTLQVVGAYYELSTGRVSFSEPVSLPSKPAVLPKVADK